MTKLEHRFMDDVLAKMLFVTANYVINIVDFKMLKCNEFHSEFQALEVTRHERLTDKFCMHYFELPKLPNVVGKNDVLQLWLSLFKAETEEELADIQAYQRITVTPEFKEVARLRSLARHNEATALYYERLNAMEEFAKSMLADKEPIEKIIKHTKLTRKQIEELQS